VINYLVAVSEPSSSSFTKSPAADPFPKAPENMSMQAEFLKRQAEIHKMVAEIKKRVKEEQDGIDARLKLRKDYEALAKVSEPKPVEKAVEVKVKEEPVKEEAKEAPKEEPKPEGSQMIFPTLEKESPGSSTHDIIAPSSSSGTQTAQTAPTAPASHHEEELFEDAETVEILDTESSDDEGFLTDEEYDILDASDEEVA